MKPVLSFALALWPLAGAADCTGVDYLDTLGPAAVQALDATVAAIPRAEGLAWRAVRGADELVVIGTIHVFDPRLGSLYADFAPLVAEAEVLLVEAGPEEEAAMQAALAAQPDLIFITDGPTLPEQLDEADWQALSDAARARQIPPFLAAKMQPWYLALTLSLPACALPDLASGARGLDHLLMQAAADKGVPVKALEPWDTLFTLMRSGTAEEQLDMLRLGLLPVAVQDQMYVAMLNSYFDEQVALIWEASRIATRAIPGLDPAAADALFAETEAMLLVDRNRNWMTEIESVMGTHDRVVMAVGAAHLPGTDGVLELLAADGWTLTRIE